VALSPSAFKYRGSVEEKRGGKRESWRDFFEREREEKPRERLIVLRRKGETEIWKQQFFFREKGVKRSRPKH